MKKALAVSSGFVLAWLGWALLLDSQIVRFLVGAAAVVAAAAVIVIAGWGHDTR